MKTIIIYAHPNTPGSHCRAILDETIRQLKHKRRKYELLDLYAIGYDPVMTAKELYTVPGSKPSKQTLRFQKKIGDAHSLIFIYPVWWNSMPAMMKGFVDKTFTSGFAFKYDHHGIPHSLLKGKRATVFQTTSSSAWQHWLIQGARAGHMMSIDILWFSGINAKVCRVHKCRRLSDERLPQIRRIVERGLGHLF